ncbi:MAG: DUF4194 domain-containing protein [Vigna little leaf phytoplasma]|nr:DUF4194 domain-containing protein [Vigna little leaf phytoplasma]
MDDKTQALNFFVDKFTLLKEQEKNIFSKIVNKLLQVNYLTKQKKSDENDYRFILLYKDIFETFLKLLDFNLEIKKHDEVLFIRNVNHFNKLKLKKEESLLLLILRILFQKKREISPSHVQVEILLKQIYKELNNIGFVTINKLTKKQMKETLMLFRQYNIIDYIDYHNILSDDLSIKIYPSILYLIDVDMIKQYKESLTAESD